MSAEPTVVLGAQYYFVVVAMPTVDDAMLVYPCLCVHLHTVI